MDKEYNVNGNNMKDFDSDFKESKDTSTREKTQEHSYKNFNFFNQKTKEEKKMKRRGTYYVCQNQLFFYQK